MTFSHGSWIYNQFNLRHFFLSFFFISNSLNCLFLIGETPLIHAARQGHTETSKYLIERGANLSIPSDLGATALHHSAGIGESQPRLFVNCLFFFASMVS